MTPPPMATLSSRRTEASTITGHVGVPEGATSRVLAMSLPAAPTERTSATMSGLVGGLVASIIVVVLSTWLAAETDRRETIRTEKRSAFVELIGAAKACEMSALQRVVKQAAFEPSLRQIRREANIRFRESRRCIVPLTAAAAKVYLVADEDLSDQGYKVSRSATRFQGSNLKNYGKLSKRFLFAISDFEVLARDELQEPVFSPLSPALTQLAGLAIAGLIFWFVVSTQRRLFRRK